MTKGGDNCLKKTNLLVYQTPVGEKTPKKPCESAKSKFKAPIDKPRPKQIRVCTGRQVKRMCQPKVCECPPGGKGGIFRILGMGLKAAVAAAAVYVSYDLGVWGTVEDTQELYRKFCAASTEAKKSADEKWSPPSCEAQRDFFSSKHDRYGHCRLPPVDMERSRFEWEETWNSGVQSFFTALVHLPETITNLYNAAVEKSKELGSKKKKCQK